MCIRDRYRPALVVILETEIWPNLFHAARRSGARLMMANARLSARSVRGYGRFAGLVGDTLTRAEHILAQGERDAQRFMDIGAQADSVSVSGNLKFDVSLPSDAATEGQSLRTAWGVDRPVLTAGSTHEADELALIEAWPLIRRDHPLSLIHI